MATSKLQIMVGDMLDKKFPEYHIRENYRPDWLISPNGTRMELDFYIEELQLAFEIQGEQHYRFIQHFHKTYSDFEKRKQYDEEKRGLCFGAGIKLIEICTETDAIVEIKKMFSNKNDFGGVFCGVCTYTNEQYKELQERKARKREKEIIYGRRKKGKRKNK